MAVPPQHFVGSASVVRYVRSLPEASVSDRMIVILVDAQMRLLRVTVKRVQTLPSELARETVSLALVAGASGIIIVENRANEHEWPAIAGNHYQLLSEQLLETGVSLIDVIQVRGAEVRALSALHRAHSE